MTGTAEVLASRLRLTRWGVVAALALLAAVYVRALEFTPLEATQGAAQKIFYIHVPSAWTAFLAYGVVGVCSVLYLFLKDLRLDRFAACSAEVGTVFCTGVLISGPIWGKPIWGTWWTWDFRLSSTLFLWFLFVGYIVLRGAVTEPRQRARFSAVLGILGMLLVPFIHVSVTLFRTLHPQPVVLKPEGPSLPGSMLVTLLFSFLAFTLMYVGFVVHRYTLAKLAEVREAEAGDA
ncbi:MAG TPA: cytochrome c biogenesis protein CcsA [Gemmatimonadales bacterium]|nr:cytochrome c biogenesis protein CcsA [Gemmatimonadales bacterium]